jgi:hypothetical protein
MKASLQNPSSRWLAALCLGFLVAQSPAQSFVEILARIEMVRWRGESNQPPAVSVTNKFSVRCIVGTNRWRIETDRSKDSREAWFYDGTNVYNCVRITRPLPEEERAKFTKATGFATVPYERAKSNLCVRVWASPSGHPLADFDVNLPWLAYGSGSYLKQEDRLIPLPVALLRHTRDRFAYRDETTTFPDEFGLPRTVDLLTSKRLLEISEDDFDREAFFGDRYAKWKKKIVAELKEDVLKFHYEVTASTNFQGWTVPTRFEFFQNGREYEQMGDVFARGTGISQSIRSAEAPEGLFQPELEQTIVDWRFRDPETQVDALIYTSTNAFVWPTNDVVLQQKFKAWREQFSRHRKAGQ